MEGESLTFTRTAASRVVSGSVLLLTAVGLGWIFSRGLAAAPVFPAALLGFFFLLSAFLSVSNIWDRIEVDGEGIRIRNRAFEAMGWRPRLAAWDDIRSLEEHRGRTLFVRLAAGRPLVLDAVAGYESLRRLVQERTGITIRSRRRRKTGQSDGPDAG